MPELRLHESIAHAGRDAWNACFTESPETYDYLYAAETAGIQGFLWRYLCAYQNGFLIAAIPAFLTEYQLDTTLPRSARGLTDSLKKLFPGALTLKLASLGSPVTEYGQIGFHPSVNQEDKPAILKKMLHFFEASLAAQGYRLLALKDIPAPDEALWSAVAKAAGYKSVNGLPSAYLDLPFTTIDAYFSTLSHATRKDMRRKLRTRDSITVEYRTHIEDVLPRVMQLYADTHARADLQFEELTPEFFRNFVAAPDGHSVCVLYWHDQELLAANFLRRDSSTLLDKYFVMDSQRGREHNLYFLSWFTCVEYCLTHGLTRFQSGQAAYENKLRLGSKLVGTRMMFRHLNPILNSVLRLASPLLEADDPLKMKEAA